MTSPESALRGLGLFVVKMMAGPLSSQPLGVLHDRLFRGTLDMRLVVFVLLLSAIAIASCGSDPPSEHVYRQPDRTEDGFETGSLAEVDLDEASIGRAVDDIERGKFGEVHSLLI